MRLIWAGGALTVAAGLLLWRPWAGTREGSGPAPSPGKPAASVEADAARASALLARAERLMADRDVRPENLPEAIGLLEECRELLRPLAERDPAPFVSACEALRSAREARDAALKNLWTDYRRQSHLGEHAKAQGTLRHILRVVPDREDPENRDARAELSRYLSAP